MQLSDDLSTGQVKRQSLGTDDNIVGPYNYNPILNSIVYKVKFTVLKIKRVCDQCSFQEHALSSGFRGIHHIDHGFYCITYEG